MITIAVAGACGRMAGRVISLAVATGKIQIVSAIDAPDSSEIGRDIGELLGIGSLGTEVVGPESLASELEAKAPEFLVDFTNPKSCVQNAKVASEKGVGLIIGTTGLSEGQSEELRKAAKNSGAPGIIASNFSMGMNVLFKLAAEAAGALEGYDIEIIEAHHNKKKDAPSGTAMTLGEVMERELERDLSKDAVYGREGMVGQRKKGEIGMHAIRAGDIAGEHTVLLAAPGERLELKYMAHSRDAFANGCVQTIIWLSGKDAGLYEMKDVLGL